jgi:hypothetical protein
MDKLTNDSYFNIKTAKKKSKTPKSYTKPYNAFAVCNDSVGGKGEKESKQRKKWERCVEHLHDQNLEKKKSEYYFDIEKNAEKSKQEDKTKR